MTEAVPAHKRGEVARKVGPDMNAALDSVLPAAGVPNRANDPRRKVGSYYVTARSNEHTGTPEVHVEAGENLRNAGETSTARRYPHDGRTVWTNYVPPKYVWKHVDRAFKKGNK